MSMTGSQSVRWCFARAAITKYHILGGLNHKSFCLTVLEAGSQKSRCQQGPEPSEGAEKNVSQAPLQPLVLPWFRAA